MRRIVGTGGRPFLRSLSAAYLLSFSPVVPSFADSPQTEIAAPPAWMAKSSREMMAMRDGRVPGPDFTKRFSKTNVQIVMRDGAEMHTEIYAPRDQKESLPIILV